MKIIAAYDTHLLADLRERPNIRLGVDSASIRLEEPLFIEGDPKDWNSLIVPALRIGRLGASIHRQSARSFFDAIGVYHLLTPTDEQKFDALWGASDRTFAPCRWITPIDSLEETKNVDITVVREPLSTRNPACEVIEYPSKTFSLASIHAIDAICAISRYITFRTGDVLLFPDYGINAGEPTIDTRLTATLAGVTTLALKLK